MCLAIFAGTLHLVGHVMVLLAVLVNRWTIHCTSDPLQALLPSAMPLSCQELDNLMKLNQTVIIVLVVCLAMSIAYMAYRKKCSVTRPQPVAPLAIGILYGLILLVCWLQVPDALVAPSIQLLCLGLIAFATAFVFDSFLWMVVHREWCWQSLRGLPCFPAPDT